MKILSLFFIFIFPAFSSANCDISDSRGNIKKGLQDPLFQTLTKESICPTNVLQFKKILESDGLSLRPSMVANRGRHNLIFGSFSFFESVTGKSPKISDVIKNGHFFFGHFTTLINGEIELDQKPRQGKLLIELIAWDYQKKYFNFYELIGTSNGGKWFYRGDSKDAYLDNIHLKRQPNPSNPQFGRRMRCSACHTSGGPIMKELEYPHNDWWTSKRPLDFGEYIASKSVQKWLQALVPAQDFSISVKKGIEELNKSTVFSHFKKNLTLQEQLRPLFCTQEINLISGNISNMTPSNYFEIKSSYWVNPFFTMSTIKLNHVNYFEALRKLGMKFPETDLIDADHPWLAPVKGYSDIESINTLIRNKIVTREFVGDVLAIDFKNPLFSTKRCGLLREVPNLTSANWFKVFMNNLKTSTLEGSSELVENLENPTRSFQFHKEIAIAYIRVKQEQLESSSSLVIFIKELQGKRQSVFHDEISKNPLGQILEPGFRVIFPLF